LYYVKAERVKASSGSGTTGGGGERGDSFLLENHFVRVVVSSGGVVRSLVDKRSTPPRELMQQQGSTGAGAGAGAVASGVGASGEESEWWDAPFTPAHGHNHGHNHGHTDSSPQAQAQAQAHSSGQGNLLCLHDDLPFFWDAWDVFPYHMQTGAPVNGDDFNPSAGSGKHTTGRVSGTKKVSVTVPSAISLPSSSGSSSGSAAGAGGGGTRMKVKRSKAERPLWDSSTGTGLRIVGGEGAARRVELVVKVPLAMPATASSFGAKAKASASSGSDGGGAKSGRGGGKGATKSAHAKHGKGHGKVSTGTGTGTGTGAGAQEEKKKKRKEEKELGALLAKGKKHATHTDKDKDKDKDKEKEKAHHKEEKNEDPPSPSGSVNTAATETTTGTSVAGTLRPGVHFADEAGADRGAGAGAGAAVTDTDADYTLMTVSLEASSAMLSFSHQVTWRKQQHKLLKVSFPLAIQSEQALYEVQNGVLARPTHGNTTFDDARLEVCAQRFAAVQESDYGVALINDGKYGHSCRENMLSLSLLRSPRSPDDNCDLGVHHFSYHLLPYQGNVTRQYRNHPGGANFNPGQGSGGGQGGDNHSESVLEAASRVNSPLMLRDMPQELTPKLLQYLSRDVAWRVQHGPSLAKVVPLLGLGLGAAEGSGDGGGGSSTRGMPLMIDAVKLAEGFDFTAGAGVALSHEQRVRQEVERQKERERLHAHGGGSDQQQQHHHHHEPPRRAYPANCDIIVRMVEMGGCRGRAALALHPSLLPRIKRCRFVKLDESPHDQDLGASPFDYHVPTYNVRGAQGMTAPAPAPTAAGAVGSHSTSIRKVVVPGVGPALEVPYEPYKIITVRIELHMPSHEKAKK
jgi:hypothetical protein